MQAFHDDGVSQGICTNKPEGITRQILEEFSIARYFACVVGGDTTHGKKPDPLPLRECLGGLRAVPRDSLLIGDSAVDVATAKAVPMPVGIVRHGYARAPVETLGADFLVCRLADLPKKTGSGYIFLTQ